MKPVCHLSTDPTSGELTKWTIAHRVVRCLRRHGDYQSAISFLARAQPTLADPEEDTTELLSTALDYVEIE